MNAKSLNSSRALYNFDSSKKILVPVIALKFLLNMIGVGGPIVGFTFREKTLNK
jgi:hypothetical protein